MLRNIFAASLLVTALVACQPAPPPPPEGVGMISSARTLEIQYRHLDTVNALRAVKGLSPLRLSPELNAAAVTHARDMAMQNRPWHFGSDGTSPQTRAIRAGFPGLILSENIAETYEHDVDTLKAWMNSRATRNAILDPNADSVGFDWMQESDGKLWWVQLIGDSRTPAPRGTEPQAQTLQALTPTPDKEVGEISE